MQTNKKHLSLRTVTAVTTACALFTSVWLPAQAEQPTPGSYSLSEMATDVRTPDPLVSLEQPVDLSGSATHDLSDQLSKVTSLSRGSVVVSFKTNANAKAATLFSVSDSTAGARNMSLTINSGHLYWEVRDSQGNSGPYISQADAEDAHSLNDGHWHTAVVTVDGVNTGLWVDGQQMFTTTGLGFFDSLTHPDTFTLGANVDNNGVEWLFDGTIRVFSVYDEVLGKAQIQRLTDKPDAVAVLSDDTTLDEPTQEIIHRKAFTAVARPQQVSTPVIFRLMRGATSVSEVEITQSALVVRQGGSSISLDGDWGSYAPDSVAVTFDNNRVTVYADGTYVGTGQLDARSLPSVDGIEVSGAEVAIYGQVLSTPQIQTIVGYDKPKELALMDIGYNGAASYRIPSLLLTQAGTLIAGADQRVADAHDSPNDINLTIRRSTDFGQTWEPLQVLIDLPGDARKAASVIDSVFMEDKNTGRIVAVVDLFPGGVGQPNNARGTGFDDQGRLKLDGPGDTSYHLNEEGTVETDDGQITGYTIDEDGTVFLDGVELNSIYDAQSKSSEVPLGLFMQPTAYMVSLYSDDQGKTWSSPRLISQMVKEPWMKFIGTGPGTAIQIDGGEHDGRLVVPVYFSNRTGRVYSSAVIYSDDGGETWSRGSSPNDGRQWRGRIIDAENATNRLSSLHESTVVQTGANELTLFMRNLNPGRKLGVARSTDGGETWSEPTFDDRVPEIFSQPNAISFGDDMSTILFANASARLPFRGRGVIRMSPDGGRTWSHARTFNDGHYVYQAMVMLPNGNIGLFWEREWQGLYFSQVPVTWLTHYGATEIH
ncbi:exo-alpha-sialidase [Corynebacterium sp. CCM 8862]|uniref:exo-alpha-sialidase n=2 Tax=Corynebacterium mendelii TaxID=2765362 RepID=A0A939DZ49_9CORY|nr:exo-alpha-sialidase [Corynebacterium mendelii]